MQGTQALKQAIREPYIEPGGYLVAIYVDGGDRVCTDCAKSHFRELLKKGEIVTDIYWEGPPDYCTYCSITLPSEYGDPDGEGDMEHSGWVRRL